MRSFRDKLTTFTAKKPTRTSSFFIKKNHTETSDVLNVEIDNHRNHIWRLQSVVELQHNIKEDKLGNDPLKCPLVKRGTKKFHFNMPRYIGDNDSALLQSYSFDAYSALNYAAKNIFPNYFVLVKCSLPPVYCVPANHAKYDSIPFHHYHEFRRIKEESLESDGVVSTYPFQKNNNTIELTKEQNEIAAIVNTINLKFDFRPNINEGILAVYYVWGGFNSYALLKDPNPVFNHNSLQRGWSIEVFCPEDHHNYNNIMKEASEQKMLNPGCRFLTLDDALAIVTTFNDYFKPQHYNVKIPTQIIKQVPEDFPIGSDKMVNFAVSQHTLFRKNHNFPLQQTMSLDQQEEAYKNLWTPC